MIDVLCSDLEVAHRYLEGKYEALKILQSKVERHTHTQIAATHTVATIVQMELQTPPKQQMKQILTVASLVQISLLEISPIYFDRY